MKEIKDLSIEELKTVYYNASMFLQEHSEHVHSLLDKRTPNIAPSGSDMFKPELWKGIHWVWFLSMKGSSK